MKRKNNHYIFTVDNPNIHGKKLYGLDDMKADIIRMIGLEDSNNQNEQEKERNAMVEFQEPSDDNAEIITGYVLTLGHLKNRVRTLYGLEWEELTFQERLKMLLRVETSMTEFVKDRQMNDGEFIENTRHALREMIGRTVIYDDHIRRGMEYIGKEELPTEYV